MSENLLAHPTIGPNGSATATIDEAAKFIGLSRSTVYQLIRRGALPFVYITSRRRLLWDDLIAFINRGGE